MAISDKADPARHIDLEPYRDAIRRAGAPILWRLIAAIREPGLGRVDREVAEDLFDRISDEILWAVTEILPSDEWKLLSQRYISFGVREMWLAAMRRGSSSVAAFVRDPQTQKVAVRHEHVVPRKLLKSNLLSARDEAHVGELLHLPVACVVTLDEDARLPKSGKGWERYRAASVRVFDRKTQVELELSR